VRAVHATNAAKAGIAAPVSNGLPINGSSEADAFSALIQALGDLSGQTSGSGTGSGSNANTASNGDQDPQAQSASSSSAAPATNATLTGSVVAVVAPATSTSGSGDAKSDQSGDPNASTASQSDSTTTVPDPNLLALLATPGVQAAQQAAPPTGVLPTGTAQAPAPGAASPSAAANPQAAADLQSAANGTTTDAGSANPSTRPPGAQSVLANPPSPAARLTGQGPMQAGGGLTKTTTISQSSAAQTAASTPVTASGMHAAQPLAPTRDTGIAPTQTNGLPQAPSHTPNASDTGNQNSARSDAHTTSDNQPSATDASAAQAQPGATAPSPAGAVDPSATAVLAVAASKPTAIADQAAAIAPAQDSQSLALASRAAALAASAVAQVSVMVQRAGLSRVDSLTVQLDPAELGRVEVRLKLDKGGTVHAAVTADRPQTLDMLRNDKASLEKALQSAGLNTDAGSMSFNLRNNGNSNQQAWSGGTSKAPVAVADDASTSTTHLSVIATDSGWTEAGRLDLRV